MGRGVSLLIVKDQSAEDAASPEFRYLLSWVVNQARRVFGTVTLEVRRANAPRVTLARAAAVLLLGRANVLCTARSLGRLRDALAAGADIAVPRPLTGVPLAEHPPLYTLHDFELLEAEVLEDEHEVLEDEHEVLEDEHEVLEGEARSSDGQETQLPISPASHSA